MRNPDSDQTSDGPTCRLPTCDRDPRGSGDGVRGFAAAFCSAEHEIKYDHLKADAREARLDAERGR